MHVWFYEDTADIFFQFESKHTHIVGRKQRKPASAHSPLKTIYSIPSNPKYRHQTILLCSKLSAYTLCEITLYSKFRFISSTVFYLYKFQPRIAFGSLLYIKKGINTNV